jgi:hypothetical protein
MGQLRGPSVVQQDILWCHLSMDDPMRVSVPQAAGQAD